MKPKIEFIFNPSKNITEIYVRSGSVLVDILTMPGSLSWYQRKKIRRELIERETNE